MWRRNCRGISGENWGELVGRRGTEGSVYWQELVRWGCSATAELAVPERRRRPQGIRRWSRGNGEGVTARAAGGVIRTSVWRPFTDLGNMEISLGDSAGFLCGDWGLWNTPVVCIRS